MAGPVTVITGPLHAHGARTADEYREMQARHLRQLKRLQPSAAWGEPHGVVEVIPALVSGGRWVVLCACGNAPSADPEWNLACCFECGAIYDHVVFPADRATLEALLLQRPRRQQHWTPGETLTDLAIENVSNGVV